MDCVKLELEHNPRLSGDYGTPQIAGPRDRWTVSVPHHRGECRLEAFGIGMSPRGRRHGEHRPTEFIGDDLEDAELARNPEREQNLWDWLMDEVLPALEPDQAVFTVLGTMFGPQCMMARAQQLAGHRDAAGRPLGRVFLQKATENGHSVWPERFSDEALDRVRATIGLRNWLRNYALSPDDPSRPFRPDWMATYRPEDVDPQGLDVVAFLDPAVSSTGCPRALVAVGADRQRHTRYVLDAWIERGSPMEMIRKLFEFNRRFKPRVIGIEQNGGYALIRPLLWQVGGRRLPVRYVRHSRPKALRIESLCAAFEQGRWRFPAHPSAGVKTLQEQFLSYPDGYVDGPDAAAGCEELLPSAGAAQDRKRYRRVERRTDYASL
jgi:predicted phage terminase large subunit-like protein